VSKQIATVTMEDHIKDGETRLKRLKYNGNKKQTGRMARDHREWRKIVWEA
jgi:hypothetical protein